jgi:hypothetical protein
MTLAKSDLEFLVQGSSGLDAGWGAVLLERLRSTRPAPGDRGLTLPGIMIGPRQQRIPEMFDPVVAHDGRRVYRSAFAGRAVRRPDHRAPAKER